MTEITARLSTALADRYKIESHLGEGGMANVYLAHDVKHDRKVAVKVLRPELAAVLGPERFVQEIKTTANLQHPHILPRSPPPATSIHRCRCLPRSWSARQHRNRLPSSRSTLVIISGLVCWGT